jgi:hypothetical protein
MVKCICINDKGKPNKIPTEKWIKEGQEYTIAFASYLLPQKELGFQIEGLDLGRSCFPYEYFLANRFGFTLSEFNKLMDFVKECNEITISVKELIAQTKIVYP